MPGKTSVFQTLLFTHGWKSCRLVVWPMKSTQESWLAPHIKFAHPIVITTQISGCVSKQICASGAWQASHWSSVKTNNYCMCHDNYLHRQWSFLMLGYSEREVQLQQRSLISAHTASECHRCLRCCRPSLPTENNCKKSRLHHKVLSIRQSLLT